MATTSPLRGSYFHNNQMELLAGDNPRSEIVIEYSIFSGSRSDSALTHGEEGFTHKADKLFVSHNPWGNDWSSGNSLGA